MVILYCSYYFVAVVQRGKPCPPMPPSWPKTPVLYSFWYNNKYDCFLQGILFLKNLLKIFKYYKIHPFHLYSSMISIFFSIQNLFNNKVVSGVRFHSTVGLWVPHPPELLALQEYVGFGVAVRGSWGLTKMPVYISALTRTREKDGATVLVGFQGQLVEGEDFVFILGDTTPGAAAHMKCTHLQFGHLLVAHVIGCSPLVPTTTVVFTSWPGSFTLQITWERDLGSQLLWLLNNHLVEYGVDSFGQKPVQLDQQPWVDVLVLELLVLKLLDFVVAEVNSHNDTCCSTRSGKSGFYYIHRVCNHSHNSKFKTLLLPPKETQHYWAIMPIPPHSPAQGNC